MIESNLRCRLFAVVEPPRGSPLIPTLHLAGALSASAARPAPAPPAEAKTPLPRKAGRPAVKLQAVLDQVLAGQRTRRGIAARLNETVAATSARLWVLRNRGLVTSVGNRRGMHWLPP